MYKLGRTIPRHHNPSRIATSAPIFFGRFHRMTRGKIR